MKSLTSFFIVLFLAASLPFSTLRAQEFTELSIAFFNVENLFDTTDDPDFDDEEFLPTANKAWTQARYQTKLKQLTRIADSLAFDDAKWPDLLGVCEVENKQVLDDWIKTAGADRHNFAILHDSKYHRGVDVGLIYNHNVFVPDTSIAHPIVTINTDYISRDILEVRGKLFNGDPLTIFVNHWPSRAADSPVREAVADSLYKFVNAAMKAVPGTGIILMGDFNDEPSNPSIGQHLFAAEDLENTADDQLYCLFPTGSHKDTPTRGSHCYKGSWHQLDNIIVWQYATVPYMSVIEKFGANAYPTCVFDLSSADVYDPDWMRQGGDHDYSQYPNRTYVGDRYLGGWSDHFPVRVKMYCR